MIGRVQVPNPDRSKALTNFAYATRPCRELYQGDALLAIQGQRISSATAGGRTTREWLDNKKAVVPVLTT